MSTSRPIPAPSAVIRKAQPDMSAVHANRPLTSFSVKYTRETDDFAALRIFPQIPVSKASDFYWKYMRGYQWRNEVKKRAPNSETVEMGYGLEQGNYTTDIWGVHIDVPWEVQANADGPAVNPDEDATEMVTFQQLLNMDVQLKANYFKTGVWGQDLTGVASGPTADQFVVFSDYTNSDPIGVIRSKKRRIRRMTGKRANVLAISVDVFDVLVEHPDVIDRIKYSTQTNNKPAIADEQTLAALFGLEEIILLDTPQNTAKEKANTTAPAVDNLTMADIFSDEMLLFHRPKRVGMGTITPGATFTWTAYPGAGANGMRVSKIPLPTKHSNRVESESSFGQAVVCPDAAIYWTNVI